MQWFEIIQGPIDEISSDVDPMSRSLETRKSKSYFCE